MITVYESIARNWLPPLLATIDPVHIVIDVEIVPDWQQFGNAGLFNSPNDITTPMMGGQEKRTEFKSFYIRRNFVESALPNDFQDRLENENYMEKLKKVIHDANLDSAFPNDGREWVSIEVNAGIYPSQKGVGTLGREAFYLCPLRLEYII